MRYSAALLESRALGAGQTVQSQGIIHGGGKYAIHGPSSLPSVEAIKEMPGRWRAHLRGERAPDLRAARLLSERCLLWLPKGSLLARLQSYGFVTMLGKTGMLHAAPISLPQAEWPEALRGSAIDAYTMAEPVLDTMSMLAALAAPLREQIHSYDPGPDASGVLLGPDGTVELASPHTQVRARAVVLAAGSGNGALLARAGLDAGLMQERPLRMFLLRGDLKPLFGHCVVGTKPQVTITSATDAAGRVVWNVGGEVAEKTVGMAPEAALREAAAEIRRALPGLDLSRVEIAQYDAQRAEARTASLRRPSGVHASRVATRLWAAWPTKLALAPLLAEDLAQQLSVELGPPGDYHAEPFGGPCPPVASPPWEQAAWSPVP